MTLNKYVFYCMIFCMFVLAIPTKTTAEQDASLNQSASCWQQISTLPQPMSTPLLLAGRELIIYNEHAYLFGGQSSEDNQLLSVYYSDIYPNGTLGPWTTTTSLPGRYYDHAVVRVNNDVYLITGAAGDTSVYTAPLNATGSLGTWVPTTRLSASRQNFAATSYGRYIYVSGGNSVGTQSSVKFAYVQADGSLGSWQDTTSLPEAIEGHTMIARDNYLYVFAPDSSVYFASIAANGTVGTWMKTSSLPEQTTGFTTVEDDGNIYLIGGSTRSVYYASVLNSGFLSTWQRANALPELRRGMWSGAHEGTIFAVGGHNGNVHHDTAYSISIDSLSNCSCQVSTENVIRPKVLILNYNPYLPSVGKSVFEYENPNYTPPMVNSRRLAQDFCAASDGYVAIELVDEREIKEFPPEDDGGRLTESEYLSLRSQGLNYGNTHNKAHIDLEQIMSENGVNRLINDHTVDEVWLYLSWTYSFYESNMGGPGAFWVNGPTFNADTNRAYAVVGLEAARGGGLHSIGHRAESTMNLVYGDGLDTPWASFRKNPRLGSDYLPTRPMGVGDVHSPPNAHGHYEYGISTYQQTNAPDWQNFPHMTGATEIINCETWGCYEDGYLLWWYSHFPKVPGMHARANSAPNELRQNNWWKYVFNFTHYAELVGEKNVAPCHLEGCGSSIFIPLLLR